MTCEHLKELAACRPIVLGSRSPRRRRLLAQAGIHFRQIIPELEENQLRDEPPYDFAERLARNKAHWVTERVVGNDVIIGCDTIVVLNGIVLGKPDSEQAAFETLSALSGNQHTVCTAVALASKGRVLLSGREVTAVHFNTVTPSRIRDYIATKEPMDKAGAYGIQGMGSFLVDRIDGNLDNVIGLPRKLLNDLAKAVVSML